MKNIFISLFLILFISTPLLSKAEPAKTKTVISSNTVESLMNGINSSNLGLRTGAAFMLGELNIKSAVVPLMKILRNDKSEEARIVAALALYKLGTPMSINALLQASKFEENERVRKNCSRFYFDFISKQNLAQY